MREKSVLEKVRAELFVLEDEKYRDFTMRDTPNHGEMIGVRIPEIRKIAKRLAKENFAEFLAAEPKIYFEEIMLHGIVIMYAKISLAERIKYLNKFLPRITNWNICDAVCASYQIPKDLREEFWEYLKSLKNSPAEFTLRFMIVMMKNNFLDEEYLEKVFEIMHEISTEKYYVKMAIAWLMTEAMAICPETARKFFVENNLDEETLRKAISKCQDSYRVSKADKKFLRGMREALNKQTDDERNDEQLKNMKK